MPAVEQFNFRDKTEHFQCSTLNFHNFGRNQHFLILKKANKSSFSLVLSSIFEILLKTPQS